VRQSQITHDQRREGQGGCGAKIFCDERKSPGERAGGDADQPERHGGSDEKLKGHEWVFGLFESVFDSGLHPVRAGKLVTEKVFGTDRGDFAVELGNGSHPCAFREFPGRAFDQLGVGQLMSGVK
jgi:hypothetical protein